MEDPLRICPAIPSLILGGAAFNMVLVNHRGGIFFPMLRNEERAPMKLRVMVTLSVAAFAVFATNVRAQGTATWAKNSPMTGTVVQTISCQGTSMPATDWTWTGVANVQFVQVGGGPLITNTTTLTVDTNSGNWGPSGAVNVPGQNQNLTSNVKYTVTVLVQMQTGKIFKTKAFVATDPGQATAK